MCEHPFTRTEMLVGTHGLKKLNESHIVIIGVGGVGSFTAEALARSGVGTLTLIDVDTICTSNLNRQIHATTQTIGMEKVMAMKERILSINPHAVVNAYAELFNCESADKLLPLTCDYVVDAIDMVSAKLDLIEICKQRGLRVISSMGMGNKLDPTQLVVTDIYKTEMCPLARVMRRELKKRGIKNLKVVYSTEVALKPFAILPDENSNTQVQSQSKLSKRTTPGSVSFVPSVAGLMIAGEVVKVCIEKEELTR